MECPSDVVDAIGGWTAAGVGNKYGKGHDLSVKQMWIIMLACSSHRLSPHSHVVFVLYNQEVLGNVPLAVHPAYRCY